MRSKGRMKQRLASSSVGAQSQRSRRLFRSSKRLYVKCSTAAWSDVSSLGPTNALSLFTPTSPAQVTARFLLCWSMDTLMEESHSSLACQCKQQECPNFGRAQSVSRSFRGSRHAGRSIKQGAHLGALT